MVERGGCGFWSYLFIYFFSWFCGVGNYMLGLLSIEERVVNRVDGVFVFMEGK